MYVLWEITIILACLQYLFALRDDTHSCSSLPKQEIEIRFSTKTPYRAIANRNDTKPHYPGCVPTRIWSVIRHGSRNPSKKIIKKAQTRLVAIRDHILSKNPTSFLCAKQLEQFREWDFKLDVKEQKFLVPEGENELIELAERMQNRFPQVLPVNYDDKAFYFKYTDTQRTLMSAKSFATGLFGRHRLANITYPMPMRRDPVLRFYKRCTLWKKSVDKNPDTFINVQKFLEGQEMRDALEYAKEKTQVRKLTVTDLRLIFTICAFETAWQRHNPPSVWCSLFNEQTIKALEFAEDLEYYWNDGYGYELTHRIACPTIADIFEHMEPRSKRPNATIYFTHSGTLLKLQAHLGLHKDPEPLTYKDFGRARRWHTSTIDAFATNIAFLLYECDEPMVLTLHQERVIHIPGCPEDSDLCSLKRLREIFADSLENCNFNEMCTLN